MNHYTGIQKKNLDRKKYYEVSEVESEEKCPRSLVPTERTCSNTPLEECVCTAETHISDIFPCNTVI